MAQSVVKCVMVGDGCAGKTYAAEFYTTGIQPNHYIPTVFDNMTADITIGGQVVTLNIWDTAGQEEYDRLRTLSYEQTDVVLMAFNIGNPVSLRNISSKWIHEIREHMPGVPIVLCGMQKDRLENPSDNQYGGFCTESAIKDVRTSTNAVEYHTCSTRREEGIDELFDILARTGLKYQRGEYKNREKIKKRKREREKKEKSSKSKVEQESEDNETLFVIAINSCRSDAEALEKLSSWKEKIMNGFQHKEHNGIVFYPLDIYATAVGKTLAHLLLERRYSRSFEHLLNTHEDKVINMLNIINKTGSIPEFVARDNGLAEIAEKLKQMSTKHNIDVLNCMDVTKRSYDAKNARIFHFTKHNLEDSLMPLVKDAQSKNQIESFLATKDTKDDSLLMTINSDELANKLLLAYGASLSVLNMRNNKDQNLIHVFASKGFSKSIETMMEKASAFKDENDEKALITLLLQKDSAGNTPLMSAAIHEQSEALARLLLFYYGKPQRKILSDMLHIKNNDGASILCIVHRASEMMFGPYGVLLELEKMAHMESKADNKGFLELQECLREKSGSSDETIKTLNMLKGTLPKSTPKIAIVYLRLFVGICFVPLAFYSIDVVSDALMSNIYYWNWKSNSDTNCNASSMDLNDYPGCLAAKPRFFYSISFVVAPWIFYAYEFIQNNFSTLLVEKVRKLVNTLISSEIGRTLMTGFILCFMFPVCFLVWPIISIIQNFIYCVRYETAKGFRRNKLETKLRRSSEACGRTKLLEASIEATFQPVLQWYLLYPTVLEMFVKNTFALTHQSTLNITDVLPYMSMLSSILSLAWAFTAHKATYKNGALDLTVAPISRAVLFFSDLLFIISRMNCLVIFMYSFGPGQFYPGIVFLMIHLLIMIGMHNFFTEDLAYLKEKRYFQYLHSCFLNGLANMFSNNGEVNVQDTFYITTPLPVKKRKTFIRHLSYDLVFLIEIMVLALFGYNLLIEPAEQLAANTTIGVSCACHVFGLVMKIFYNTKLHVWSDLISVIHKDKNDNWTFETDFILLANTKKITKHMPVSHRKNNSELNSTNEKL